MSIDSFVRQPQLNRWDRISIASMLLLFVSFGVVTEIRSAFQKERKTDFGVYARAGWAVRNDIDPYAVTDDHGWHYCYPPPFAIAMTPLADPPADEPNAGYLSYAVSVGIWYVLSLLAVCYAVHALAIAVRPNDPRGSRIWWLARIVPLWVCIGGIGMTLGRGQVNLVVVAFIAMAIAASIRNDL